MTIEHLDVLVVGAGISGIAAGVHLQQRCPRKSFAILEGRATAGGTWDLFRYPGIRSDSDMFSFAYSFKPWTGDDTIADGAQIREYLEEAAREHGLKKRIRFGHRVRAIDWDSASARWTVTVLRADGPPLQMSCNFLFMCTGYYAYDRAHRPPFAGEGEFAGTIVHPQFWPEGLSVQGKRVLVIGSGATAVTLVPALAAEAAHVTMVQRSPGYLVARPRRDRLANGLRRCLPGGAGHALARLKFLSRDLAFYQLAKWFPAFARRLLRFLLGREVGGDAACDPAFSPRYQPWRERLCLVRDGDLFARLRSGEVSLETAAIERFTHNGLLLASGKHLEADIIVTATGLEVVLMDGVSITVDARELQLSETVGYKGCMYSGIPNLASSFGYSNAAWTLKAELTCEYVCRLLQHMERHGWQVCMADAPAPIPEGPPMMDLDAGYIRRAVGRLPRQGASAPWKALNFYPLDALSLRHGPLEDGVMQFRVGGHGRVSASAG